MLDVDQRLEAVGVHLRRRREVDGVDAVFAQLVEVANFVARIALEVLTGPELRRVDEDADHGAAILAA